MPLTINGETIPDGLIADEFQVIKAHYERMGRTSCCERDDEFRGYARENIIARVLLNQEAERRYPDITDADISARVEQLMTEHGGREQFFVNVGLSPDQEYIVRDDVRSGLRMDRLLNEAWGGQAAPPEIEQRAWYERHLSEFLTTEEVSALHLFKLVEKVEDRDRIYNQLREFRARGKAGEDFQAIALEHTDKEDKLVDLGWFKRGDFMEEFDLIIFSLDEGEMSPVFASHWGFHLAKVTGRRPPVPIPFEQVQATVAERMVNEHRQAVTQKLVAELKAAATITHTDDSEAGA